MSFSVPYMHDWERDCEKCHNKPDLKKQVYRMYFQIIKTPHKEELGTMDGYTLCEDCANKIFDKIFIES